MLSYKIIGQNIRDAREKAGLSQEKVANELKISSFYYGKFERGQVKQNLARLEQVCEILQIPFEHVFIGASIGCVSQEQSLPETLEVQVTRIMEHRRREDREAVISLVKTICTTICESVEKMAR